MCLVLPQHSGAAAPYSMYGPCEAGREHATRRSAKRKELTAARVETSSHCTGSQEASSACYEATASQIADSACASPIAPKQPGTMLWAWDVEMGGAALDRERVEKESSCSSKRANSEKKRFARPGGIALQVPKLVPTVPRDALPVSPPGSELRGRIAADKLFKRAGYTHGEA